MTRFRYLETYFTRPSDGSRAGLCSRFFTLCSAKVELKTILLKIMIQEFIKAALLGTDKYTPDYQLDGTNLAELILSTDKEDLFLKQTASAFLYTEAGQSVLKKEFPDQAYKGIEDTYLSTELAEHFKAALQQNDVILLDFLLQEEVAQAEKLPPALVPLALNIAKKNKKLAEVLVLLCGSVGQWLAKLNIDWQQLLLTDPEVDFDTAHHRDRRRYLLELRASDPSAAITLLEQQFQQETAEKRAELLETLAVNIEASDLLFLEKIYQKDKSKKVRTIAKDLLLQIPIATISQTVYKYLQQTVSIKEKALKQQLVYQKDLELPKELLVLGLDTISKEKKIPDHIHWIAQCVALISLPELAQQLNTNEIHLITLFQKGKYVKYWNQYLLVSIVHHKTVSAASELLKYLTDYQLVELLPFEQRMKFYQQANKLNLSDLLADLVAERTSVLSKALAIKVLTELRKNPYLITAADYYPLGFYLPITLAASIEKYSLSDKEHAFFSKNAPDLLRGINIRKRVMSDKGVV